MYTQASESEDKDHAYNSINSKASHKTEGIQGLLGKGRPPSLHKVDRSTPI